MADSKDEGFERFEQFLTEWSRRDFLRRMGMTTAFTAFMAGGMEWLEACGGGSGNTGTVSQGKPGGHIVEGQISDISNVNPVFLNDTVSQIISGRAYEGLIDFDGKATRIPALATELPTVDSDNMTYHAKMRKDAKWSDGQPITADDVVFTFDLMTKDQYKDVKSRYRSQLADKLDSVTATDPYTLVFKTKGVQADFYDAFIGIGVLPKHVWSKLDPATINSTPLNQVPEVVSGAFVPVKWDKGSQYVMKRNDTFYRGKAYLDQFILKVVSDAVAVANQLKTGEIDVGLFDASQWDAMASAQSVDRLAYARPSFDYLIPNEDPAKTPKAQIFSDPEVRKALLMAINRKQAADKVYFGQADPADAPLSSTKWAHVTTKAQYPFDAAKAASMLDAAGWKKGADGIRAKNGVPMAWELRTNVGNKIRESFIQVIADAWNQLGCKVTTNPIQFPQLVTQLSQSRDFEMILLGISEGLDPDMTQLYASTSIGGGALNGAGYKNPKLDDLLKQGLQYVDRAKRKEIYAQAQELLMTDLPYLWLTWPHATWGISKRVKNFGVAAWNTYGSRPWFKDVYVTDGK